MGQTTGEKYSLRGCLKLEHVSPGTTSVCITGFPNQPHLPCVPSYHPTTHTLPREVRIPFPLSRLFSTIYHLFSLSLFQEWWFLELLKLLHFPRAFPCTVCISFGLHNLSQRGLSGNCYFPATVAETEAGPESEPQPLPVPPNVSIFLRSCLPYRVEMALQTSSEEPGQGNNVEISLKTTSISKSVLWKSCDGILILRNASLHVFILFPQWDEECLKSILEN